MIEELLNRMRLPESRLRDISDLIFHPELQIMDDFLQVVLRYGSPEEINRKAEEARRLPNLLDQVRQSRPEYRNPHSDRKSSHRG